MIVKNESKVIERCLSSIKHMIDYWVIVDTGSTDGTQKIICEYLKDIPGELHERPWENFEHNRNEALVLAKDKGDFLLFIDADEQLVFEEGYKEPAFDKDCYFASVRLSNNYDYQRAALISTNIPWRWEGVLHETLRGPDGVTAAVLEGVFNLSLYSDCVLHLSSLGRCCHSKDVFLNRHMKLVCQD